MVDGSNDVIRHKEVPFGGGDDENAYLGGLRPLKPPKFAPNQGIPFEYISFNNFKTVKDRHKVTMDHL